MTEPATIGALALVLLIRGFLALLTERNRNQ